MTKPTTVLVPVRYPISEKSARTLAAAGRIAHDNAPADLIIFHANLYQKGHDTHPDELVAAISSTFDDVDVSVTTRRGFLVEEMILEEATLIGADIVVIGKNQKALWRRILSRLSGNRLEVGPFLREHLTNGAEIMEIDTASEAPSTVSI